MLAVRVESEFGERVVRPSAAELRALVLRIGGDGDRYLVVERVPSAESVYVQVWHEDGGTYQLEHRDGGADRHFRVELDEAEAVARAMTGWAGRTLAWDDGIAWERVDFGPGAEPVPELDAAVRVQIEERVREVLRCGYAGRAVLAEVAEDYLVRGDERPVSREQAWDVVDRLWRERLDEQAEWEGVTDPERIEEVFAALDDRGITARADFTCCRSCGLSEIGAEGGADVRGFVFFHRQATEAAAAGSDLSLYYGGFDGSEDTTAAIGREVAEALRAAGLPVVWDGSPAQSIRIDPVDWRKRLPV